MKSKNLLTILTLVLLVFFSGCKEDDYEGNEGVCPLVVSTDPADAATGVPLNKVITATFNEEMNPATISTSSFTVAAEAKGEMLIEGVVTYSEKTATFTPSDSLDPNTTYTGTIKRSVKELRGLALQEDYVWTFTSAAIPTLLNTNPADLAIDVPLNQAVSATFSTTMDPLTITTSTFTVMDGVIPVTGVVTSSGMVATFTPESPLAAGKTYTATITNGAKDLTGLAITNDYEWTFTTQYSLSVVAVNGSVLKNPDQLTYNYGTIVSLTATPDAGYVFSSWSGDVTGIISPKSILMNANKNVTANFTLLSAVCTPPVDLGLSGDYVILAESGISTTGVTSIVGNMGISPAAETFITGFALTLPAGGAFSTSDLVTGNVYAPGYAAPTPSDLTTAIDNMTTAFTTANGLAAGTTELLAGNLNSQTLSPGVYKWSTGLLITTGLTLDGGGDPCASWVFQIAGDLTVANSTIITLANGADARNIFWIVAGSKAELGTAVDFSGNILSKTLISLNTGATVLGRLLAQTAVTLNASTVTLP